VKAWESVYRACSEAEGEDITGSSREVAIAWRSLAESTRLPWWLRAAVYSAAEAFEQQAEAWAAYNGSGAGGERTDVEERRTCGRLLVGSASQCPAAVEDHEQGTDEHQHGAKADEASRPEAGRRQSRVGATRFPAAT
jgi:hypothetical protein